MFVSATIGSGSSTVEISPFNFGRRSWRGSAKGPGPGRPLKDDSTARRQVYEGQQDRAGAHCDRLGAWCRSLRAWLPSPQHHDVGLVMASLSGAGFVVGAAWLAIEHRQVRRIEERWYAEHPDAQRQWPSS